MSTRSMFIQRSEFSGLGIFDSRVIKAKLKNHLVRLPDKMSKIGFVSKFRLCCAEFSWNSTDAAKVIYSE
jgi:hypothetical protein